MATVEQCERALQDLADKVAGNPSRRKLGFDRSMSCTISDIDAVFAGRLKDGRLLDIARSSTKDAQVRLTLSSDDLIALVDGSLKIAPAWATGRIKVEAGMRDLLKLRSIF